METSRRNFLKAGGACLLGLTIWPAVKGFAGNSTEYITSSKALTGEKWGLVIDMKKCWPKYQEGCRECFLACQRAHNIPDVTNKEEEIKWIWTEPYENAFPEQEHEYIAASIKGKPFIVLCNHCENPPCVRVCPTKATFKRRDGIVMMDYHRCIGCRYCMAACPYGARSFNFSDPRPFIKEVNPEFPTREKGVVEKCNFCAERIDTGLPPACVEACPAGALVFGDLDDPNSEVRKILASRYTIQRKPELGTHPCIYYLV
ncbi:sulfate reduction electron transfer complex DsrMKJOP subunit DsrO [Neomoorella mulderi]|uniref:Tetrathionate reductase subunit B n=1 Tax=Moorella mulderi DSM 14980 TaxID=1122241 RepID=A0A151AXL9_9FIRM|nr:4Fe-4S dicluster domain-containing protein [Moorella mulderi]KYH32409.1 tetrathionate reductase subunit B precursor [Moorella mulderi DSM 14980]